MALIQYLISRLGFRNSGCIFKAGDQVVHLRSNQFMVVDWTKKTDDGHEIICCKWFDRVQQKSCKDIFTAKEIKLFDWYNPDRP